MLSIDVDRPGWLPRETAFFSGRELCSFFSLVLRPESGTRSAHANWPEWRLGPGTCIFMETGNSATARDQGVCAERLGPQGHKARRGGKQLSESGTEEQKNRQLPAQPLPGLHLRRPSPVTARYIAAPKAASRYYRVALNNLLGPVSPRVVNWHIQEPKGNLRTTFPIWQLEGKQLNTQAEITC